LLPLSPQLQESGGAQGAAQVPKNVAKDVIVTKAVATGAAVNGDPCEVSVATE